MKCIYCNSEDLTISDIIPYALTMHKIQKKFVCEEHNAFTNQNFENAVISTLGFLRNKMGLKRRRGETIPYRGRFIIGGSETVDVTITDERSFYTASKIYRLSTESGTTLIGPIETIHNIKGVSPELIKPIDLSEIEEKTTLNLEEWFASSDMIHTIAKIAFEWHCYINRIEEHKCGYEDIINFILLKDEADDVVSIIDTPFMFVFQQAVWREGSHNLFEYISGDGFLYVIVNLFDIVSYKVRIKPQHNDTIMKKALYYSYHQDGTSNDDDPENKRQLFCAGVNLSGNHSFIPLDDITASKKPIEALKDSRDQFVTFFNKAIDSFHLSTPNIKRLSSELIETIDAISGQPFTPAFFNELIDYSSVGRTNILHLIYSIMKHGYNWDNEMTLNDNLESLYGVTEIRLSDDDKQIVLTKIRENYENNLQQYLNSLKQHAEKLLKTASSF